MANGTEVYINNVHAGDVLLSYNVQTRQFYPDVVQEIISYKVYQEYVINGVIGTDSQESFYVYNPSTGKSGWLMAKDLAVGDEIYNPISGTYTTISTIDIIPVPNGVTVYDLFTTSGNNFLANGVLSGADSISS